MNDILDLLGKAGIPAIVITIIGLIAKVKPITFVTSNHFERKMSSKEWRFSYGVIMYLAQSIFYSVIIMALSELCYKWEWLNSKPLSYIFFAITVLVILGFLYFYYKQEKRKRYVPSKSLAKNLGAAGLTLLYFLGWIAINIFWVFLHTPPKRWNKKKSNFCIHLTKVATPTGLTVSFREKHTFRHKQT
jgi:hypothetical protein